MMINKKIKVLVVDDSVFARKIIVDKLSTSDKIEVIGTAINATDAKDKILKLNPDVVTMDVEMPGVSGIEFVKSFDSPIPFVMVSSLNISVFEALSAGAVDFVKKPDMSLANGIDIFCDELIRKVVVASHAKVKRTHRMNPILCEKLSENQKYGVDIIAIGASTGGTEAILDIVRNLPIHTPPIVIVQHMPAGFTKMFADRMNGICKMNVKEAEDFDKLETGTILVAPGGIHLKVIKQNGVYFVRLQSGEKVSSHCPSVDVLFESVSKICTSNAMGIILTGMGRDGASGLLKMKQAGSYTIGQNQQSCVVYGMPMVAQNIGAVLEEKDLADIPNTIISYLNKRK